MTINYNEVTHVQNGNFQRDSWKWKISTEQLAHYVHSPHPAINEPQMLQLPA